ncbi:flippase-like domain-containing protein [Candidatus Poribacteria bacterium]|nr:flippase-like domain-containing protein [Candidatus Poribacteria bacterium]
MQVKPLRLLTAVLALALAAFLVSKVQFGEIARAFRSLSLTTAFFGLLIYLTLNMVKAIRFSLLLKREISPARLFPVMLLYSFWSNLLPMRAGDLSYLYMVKAGNGIKLTRGLSSLLIGSVVDASLNLMLLLALGFYFVGELEEAASLATLFIIPLGFVLFLLGSLGLLWVKGAKLAMWFRDRRWPSRMVFDRIADLLEEIGRFRSREILLGIAPISSVALGIRLFLQCYLVDGMKFNFGWLKVIFALSFTGFLNLIPIQSIAGLGTVEAPWSWALVSLGEESGRAIASGFSLHGIIIGYSLICGGLGFTMRRLIDHERIRSG